MTARNRLAQLMQDPASFTGSPGYSFALQQGQQAVGRSAAARGMRGSGNVLAALMQHGQGLAAQDYDNEFRRRHAAAGLEQEGDQFDRDLGLRTELGRGELSLGRDRLGLDRERVAGELGLGRDRLGLDRDRMQGELGLGRDRLGLDRDRMGVERDLGFGRLSLDRDLGTGRLSLDRDRMDRDFGLGLGRLDLDRDRMIGDFDARDADRELGWYDSRTRRGSARSADWARREELRRSRPRNPWTWEPE